ncbi:MAG: hypothetical protein WC554_17745 [Clostridia bacterium]
MCTQDDRFYVSKYQEYSMWKKWDEKRKREEAVKELSKIVVMSCDRKKGGK